jgi:Tfp pilus assembly protein PilX
MSNLRRAVTRRRGMVLIIVLSVLAVMAILGISLLTLSALDKTVTDNHFWQVQARQMARSGIEDATARLRDGAVLRSAFDTDNDWMFRGDDVTGNEPAKRVTPLAWSRVPSFAKKGANGST